MLPADPQMQAVKKSIEDVLRPQFAIIGAENTLAILAQVVGMFVAVQDQNKYTPEQIMQLVMANIELGNKAMMGPLLGEGETKQ